MLVSVVVPVYNGERFLAQCLDSIVSQTYNDIEIIIVDDGSIDNTAVIAKKYLAYGNVQYYYQDNAGAPSARNFGIKVAHGEAIIFFDADDVMKQNAIQVLVANYELHQCDLIIGNFNIITEEGVELCETDYEIDEYRMIYTSQQNSELIRLSPFPDNKLYVVEIIRKNKLLFDDVRIGQDLNFFLKYIIHTNQIQLIDDVVADYRLSSGSISRSYDMRMADIVKSMNGIEEYYKCFNQYAQYEEFLNTIKLQHYDYQLFKLQCCPERKTRKEIIDLIFEDCKTILYSNKKICIKGLKRKMKWRYRFRHLYSTHLVVIYNQLKRLMGIYPYTKK